MAQEEASGECGVKPQGTPSLESYFQVIYLMKHQAIYCEIRNQKTKLNTIIWP